MEKHSSTIKYYVVKREKYDGIYVFLANEKYQEGDLQKNENCSAPLVWIIDFDTVEKVKKLVPTPTAETVSLLHLNNFKKSNREVIKTLRKTASQSDVQLMIDRVQQFIDETIASKYK